MSEINGLKFLEAVRDAVCVPEGRSLLLQIVSEVLDVLDHGELSDPAMMEAARLLARMKQLRIENETRSPHQFVDWDKCGAKHSGGRWKCQKQVGHDGAHGDSYYWTDIDG